MQLSIIIPTLNESAVITDALAALQPFRSAGHEVIVVDGGSDDGTPDLAKAMSDRAITTTRGRAVQMNAGAELARGDTLLFLHADTRLPGDSADRVVSATANAAEWGWFDVRLSGTRFLFRMIERTMNWRARLTRIATGDQAIFVRRELFMILGGYPPLPLMEDIAMCKQLRKRAPAQCIRTPVTTSSRRWEQHGVLRTMLLMWRLRLAYNLGADTTSLAVRYGSHFR
ncbi:MAG: TIGR04283 family arsenosugar biosynthesis glycosyltransferase [Gammaproteobacteria bacterium]